MRAPFSLLLVVTALLRKETSHGHRAEALHNVHTALKNDGDEAASTNETSAEKETSTGNETKEEKADAEEEKKDEEKEESPMRCELILDCSLETIHDKGGVEAFANAAESELANAAAVDRSCIHIMNLRGKYKHGMAPLELLQSLYRRDAGAEVIVDFEILPCGDQDAAFKKVEEARRVRDR